MNLYKVEVKFKIDYPTFTTKVIQAFQKAAEYQIQTKKGIASEGCLLSSDALFPVVFMLFVDCGKRLGIIQL